MYDRFLKTVPKSCNVTVGQAFGLYFNAGYWGAKRPSIPLDPSRLKLSLDSWFVKWINPHEALHPVEQPDM